LYRNALVPYAARYCNHEYRITRAFLYDRGTHKIPTRRAVRLITATRTYDTTRTYDNTRQLEDRGLRMEAISRSTALIRVLEPHNLI